MNRVSPAGLFLLAACIALSALAGCTGTPAGGTAPDEDFTDWRLTLNGTREEVLTLDELRRLPVKEGHGYAVSTVGIRYGPYQCRGVDLNLLVDMAGGMGPKDQVWVSAPDGYLWVFDAEQMGGGGFVAFNEDLTEIPSPPLTIILMYEQDGHQLGLDEGGPARIAIISQEPGIVTEGSAWVKWVDRIEVHQT